MRPLSARRPATLVRSFIQRRCIADARPFAEGDLVLLRQKIDRSANPFLTRPLQPGRKIDTNRGSIRHDDIIGKRVRDVIQTVHSKSAQAGIEYRLYEVTLEDYVRLSKRLVTPIYPADANLIVSLLDLHPDDQNHGSEEASKLEILEAGTGHGALTLYLSRAIHGINAGIASADGDYASDEWKSQRKAVIHTTDVSPKFSEHAAKIVRGFRNGIYARNVDFHVGDVSHTLQRLREARGNAQFLSHAFLDMPAADGHLANVADAIRTDGSLIVFNPSITQIISCATRVKDEQIPLDLEAVIELGINGASGGREWDVRFVRPRRNQSGMSPGAAEADGEASEVVEPSGECSDAESRTPISEGDQKWSMVCRPKVGERIIGGGFLGVWKKQRDMKSESSPV